METDVAREQLDIHPSPIEFDGVSAFYCDHNATSPMPSLLLNSLRRAYSEHWVNLSSPYDTAKHEAIWVRKLRSQFAGLSGDSNANVVFCASSTEAINQAIFSLSKSLGPSGEIIISDAEHSAVRLAASHWFDGRVSVISSKRIASQDWSELLAVCRKKENSVLFMQAANNESGVLIHVEELRKKLPTAIRLFLDASQIVGKCDEFWEQLAEADGAVISPHKFYGPKGVGVLLWKKSAGDLVPLIFGGGQENALRSGTENVPALFLTKQWIEALPLLMEHFTKVRAFTSEFERRLIELMPSALVVASDLPRLGNTCAIAFFGVVSEGVLAALDASGIMASSGSACASGTQEPSRSYLALGLTWEQARSVVRFSFGISNLSGSPTDLANRVHGIVKRLGT